jgi:aspartate aminotransferase
MIDAFKERRSLILSLLADIPGFKTNVPEGAFYVFPDISHYIGQTLQGQRINSAGDFALFLLEHAGVATVTGEAFGDPDCIRISYAVSETDIKEAVKRIKDALSKASV